MPKKVSLDDLARMVKQGFDEVGDNFKNQNSEFAKFRKENQKEHKEINLRLSHLEFIATEMVRRNEFLELRRKVELLESKLASM
ncbi:MAG: hypothetical protein M1338_05235 [Patescibacteria group bacterium]|nr:hypothetical protein [Patescibacteria group bacterium]